MEQLLLPALIVLVVVGLIAGAIWSYRQEQKRVEALIALSRELGFDFDPRKDPSHDDYYAQFEIFRRGHSRSAYNTLTGRLEIDGRLYPCKMGDFTYKITSSNGKSTTTKTYRFSYAIVHLPIPGVPALLIRRETVFDRIKSAVGFDDIDFESAEFSRRFYVTSSDKRFAYDVVHPRMMEWLLRHADSAPTIDIEHGACCVADGVSRWEPETFKRRLRFVMEFFDAWPDHLTQALETRAGMPPTLPDAGAEAPVGQAAGEAARPPAPGGAFTGIASATRPAPHATPEPGTLSPDSGTRGAFRGPADV